MPRSRGKRVQTYVRPPDLQVWMEAAGISPAAVLQKALERVRAALSTFNPEADLFIQVDELRDPTVQAILAQLNPAELERAARASR